MKRIVMFLAFLVFAAVRTVSAETTDRFVEAARAYDAGQYTNAAALYAAAAAESHPSAALYYNWGGALFKAGQLGRAIWAYRHAWRLAPRDPDIAANLRFAWQQTGAEEPHLPFWRALVFQFSQREYARGVRYGFWGFAMLLAASLLLRRKVSGLAATAWACLTFSIVAGSGWCAWNLDSLQPEAVVTAPNTHAYFAPIKGSTVHFALPEGAVVRVMDRQQAWAHIKLNEALGWVMVEALDFVVTP